MLLAFIANVIVYTPVVAVYIHFDKKDDLTDNKDIPNRRQVNVYELRKNSESIDECLRETYG